MSLQEKKLQKLKEHSMVAGDHCWHDSRRFQARENGGEWGKRKRRGKGFRFMAYHWQGLTMVVSFGRRRGWRRSVLVLLRGKRWSVDGMATRSSRADAAR